MSLTSAELNVLWALAYNFKKSNMKSKLYQNALVVKKSKTHGYGIFAGKTIRKNQKIEECYFLLTKGGDDVLEDFYFEVKEKGRYKYGLLTGFGIIYNHSEDPNADYTFNIRKRLATFKATRTIKKGEEIFITYGDEYFTTRDLKPKS